MTHDDKLIEAVAAKMNARAVEIPYDLRNHTPKAFYTDMAKAALRAVREGQQDNRWLQAGEIFNELEKGKVELYALHEKYNHSPAMVSWFTRYFASMLNSENAAISLRTQPPQGGK
jgi:hypothetical protein